MTRIAMQAGAGHDSVPPLPVLSQAGPKQASTEAGIARAQPQLPPISGDSARRGSRPGGLARAAGLPN
jgi:hypothetical protein